jgi:hypothetical protein
MKSPASFGLSPGIGLGIAEGGLGRGPGSRARSPCRESSDEDVGSAANAGARGPASQKVAVTKIATRNV